MLVLSRKVNESILIGPHIRITAVRISPRGVRLGVEAPQSLPILREELSDTAFRMSCQLFTLAEVADLLGTTEAKTLQLWNQQNEK